MTAADPSPSPSSSERDARHPVSIPAVYEDGVLRPESPLDLPEGTPVSVTVRARAEDAPAQARPSRLTQWSARLTQWGQAVRSRLRAWSARPSSGRQATVGWLLFGLAMAVYAVTRLYRLPDYPINFFGDEAFFSVTFKQLAARGFRSIDGQWLPLYFEGAALRWIPGLQVYVQGLATAALGSTVAVARGVNALATVVGFGALALALKRVFGARYWWSVVLVAAVIPAWFLHSRTAFEAVLMTSFLALFLASYLMYRCVDPRWLFPALLFGAAGFYSYSNGQAILGFSGLFLFIVDLPYHLRQWRLLAVGTVLALVLAVPFLRFRATHPEALGTHLRTIDSYMFEDIPAAEKARRYLDIYTDALGPGYWFTSNAVDIARHKMDGYPHMPLPLLPLLALGAARCLWRIRDPRYRAVVLIALAVPIGASTLGIGITRVLAFVVPASLMCTIGLEWLLARLGRRMPVGWVAVPLFVVLAGGSLFLMRRALVDGPYWVSDYGLYGMQWGARQLFGQAIPEVLEENPDLQLVVTSDWSNGTHHFIPFFLTPEQQARVQIRTIDSFTLEQQPVEDRMLVMTAPELARGRRSPKFASIDVERVIPYPDGSPGFHFARLAYVDDIEQIFARERAERRKPVTEHVIVDGQQVVLTHSRFDAGKAADMFDGDTFTLARVMEANPAFLELEFDPPQRLEGLALDLSSMVATVKVALHVAEREGPITYQTTVGDPDEGPEPIDPHIEIDFERGPHEVDRLEITIKNERAGETAKIHIYEMALR